MFRKLETKMKYVINIVSGSVSHSLEKIQSFMFVTFKSKMHQDSSSFIYSLPKRFMVDCEYAFASFRLLNEILY